VGFTFWPQGLHRRDRKLRDRVTVEGRNQAIVTGNSGVQGVGLFAYHAMPTTTWQGDIHRLVAGRAIAHVVSSQAEKRMCCGYVPSHTELLWEYIQNNMRRVQIVINDTVMPGRRTSPAMHALLASCPTAQLHSTDR
jgi:hypothetical protein